MQVILASASVLKWVKLSPRTGPLLTSTSRDRGVREEDESAGWKRQLQQGRRSHRNDRVPRRHKFTETAIVGGQHGERVGRALAGHDQTCVARGRSLDYTTDLIAKHGGFKGKKMEAYDSTEMSGIWMLGSWRLVLDVEKAVRGAEALTSREPSWRGDSV